jgi:hypothetical protein
MRTRRFIAPLALAATLALAGCAEGVLRPETIGGTYDYQSSNPGGYVIEGEVELNSPDITGAFVGTAAIRIYRDGDFLREETASVSAGFVSHGGPVRFRLAGLQHTGQIVERRIEGETEWRTEEGDAEGSGTFVMRKR